MDCVDEFYRYKDLSLLKKTTLVIPTNNRNYYLSRCLWYHAHFPFGEIIIADSSSEDKKNVNQEITQKIIKKFGTRVRYLEYEQETEIYGGDIVKKWGNAVQHVETEYTQICTDKQFLIPTSICKSIQYLEKNNDYASAGGKEYQLQTKKDDIRDPSGYFLVLGDATRVSETSNNSTERFIHSFVCLSPMHNGLILQATKSKILKYLYSQVLQYDVNDSKHSEILLGHLGHIYGKYHCLENEIYLIRDNRGIQHDKKIKPTIGSNESSASKFQNIYRELGDKPEFYEKFKNCLVNQLTIYNEITFENAQRLVDDIVKKRLEACNDPPTLRSIMATRHPFLLDIWYNLPTELQNVINKSTSKTCKFTLPTNRINKFSDKTKPESIVIKIVETTAYLQSDDLPIPLNY